ncbi:hypothetical protein E2C01_006989 [Portunus trituberculatus]|uniref:Uncharacterized protein n=1 Tax=Portunus trituberculatus TaxID=210409 RepID=A0A5B7CXZ1_PORTR|nr:hypothetical protein [Portunus trituberculatus]
MAPPSQPSSSPLPQRRSMPRARLCLSSALPRLSRQTIVIPGLPHPNDYPTRPHDTHVSAHSCQYF